VRSKRESKFAQTTKKWTAQDRGGWVYDLQIGFRFIIHCVGRLVRDS
jgi:hypothetical protein